MLPSGVVLKAVEVILGGLLGGVPQGLGDECRGDAAPLENGGEGVPGGVGGDVLLDPEPLGYALHVAVYGLDGLVDGLYLFLGGEPVSENGEDICLGVSGLGAPPVYDLQRLGHKSHDDLPLFLPGGPLGLGPHKGDNIACQLPVLGLSDVLHVHPVAQVGEEPQVPRPCLPLVPGAVVEDLPDLLHGEGLLDVFSGGDLVFPLPEGVEILVEVTVGDGVVEERPQVPQIDAHRRDGLAACQHPPLVLLKELGGDGGEGKGLLPSLELFPLGTGL